MKQHSFIVCFGHLIYSVDFDKKYMEEKVGIPKLLPIILNRFPSKKESKRQR